MLRINTHEMTAESVFVYSICFGQVVYAAASHVYVINSVDDVVGHMLPCCGAGAVCGKCHRQSMRHNRWQRGRP